MECDLCHLKFDARNHRFVGSRSSRSAAAAGKFVPSRNSGGTSSAHFCSLKCLTRWQAGSLPSVCRNCCDYLPGEASRSRRAAKRDLVFCSPDCASVFQLRMKGIFPPDSVAAKADWRHTSEAVRGRDRHVCQACGSSRSEAVLQVDHIVPYFLCKEDDTRNLLTLCVKCHGFKTDRLEPALCLGRVGNFLIGLRRGGWPMAAVRVAMRLYCLPTHERRRSMPWAWLPGCIRWPKPPQSRKKEYLLRLF